jgi:hypothetical protein
MKPRLSLDSPIKLRLKERTPQKKRGGKINIEKSSSRLILKKKAGETNIKKSSPRLNP